MIKLYCSETKQLAGGTIVTTRPKKGKARTRVYTESVGEIACQGDDSCEDASSALIVGGQKWKVYHLLLLPRTLSWTRRLRAMRAVATRPTNVEHLLTCCRRLPRPRQAISNKCRSVFSTIPEQSLKSQRKPSFPLHILDSSLQSALKCGALAAGAVVWEGRARQRVRDAEEQPRAGWVRRCAAN